MNEIKYKELLIKFIAYINDNERDRYNQKVNYKLNDLDLNFTDKEISEIKSIVADLSKILPIE